MSLNLISKITITQCPTTDYPSRSAVFVINAVNNVEIVSSWKNLTTTAKVTIPKNIYIQLSSGQVMSWVSQPTYVSVSGNNNPPILLRGDKIQIELGYRFLNSSNVWVNQTNIEFSGWITKVNPKMPMVIDCEDNMWILKQAQCPNMVFPASSYNVQSIIQYLLKNPTVPTDTTSSTYLYLVNTIIPALKQVNVFNGVGSSANVETSVGDFRTVNDTICSVLMRLRRDYKLECFFRTSLDSNLSPNGFNNLYCSGIVYYPGDYYDLQLGTYKTIAYGFQQNIIDNGASLEYLRKDDIRLGIKAYSVAKYDLTTTNSAGGKNTKNTRLEVIVGDKDGDMRTQYFFPATNTSPDLNLANLTALANQRLNRLKFEGWHGSFLSFGLPYVQHGMAVSLNDNVNSGTFIANDKPVVMERQGIYLVRGTKVKFGMGGFRRTIELHLRLDNQFTATDIANGL